MNSDKQTAGMKLDVRIILAVLWVAGMLRSSTMKMHFTPLRTALTGYVVSGRSRKAGFWNKLKSQTAFSKDVSEQLQINR
jgi:hypothetical protein